MDEKKLHRRRLPFEGPKREKKKSIGRSVLPPIRTMLSPDIALSSNHRASSWDGSGTPDFRGIWRELVCFSRGDASLRV